MTYDAPETRMLAAEGWASALVQIDHGPGHRTHRVFFFSVVGEAVRYVLPVPIAPMHTRAIQL